MAELKETKGRFKLIGKVNRIDNENAYRTGEQEKGENKGRKFRSLNFSVKTSPDNEIFVGTYDYEPKKVFLWSKDKKEKDSSYKGDYVEYDAWLKKKDEIRDKGFAIFQSRVGLDLDESGKIISHGYPRYYASKMLHDRLNNGDTVIVEGKLSFSKFKNSNGVTVVRKNHTIEKVHRLKNDIDFDADDFKEVSYFEQDIIFVDAEHDKKEEKTYITSRIVDYKGSFVDVDLVLNPVDDDLKKLSNALLSKVKFGDVLSVFGDTVNRAVEREEDDDKEDYASLLGGKQKPSHARGVSDYISEFDVHGVDNWDKKVYTEDDFEESIIDEDGKDDDLNEELGGKKKSSNPFDADEDEDLSDDDLPF